MGYPGTADGLRKKFTGYERDSESGLNYAQARYYRNTQSRFMSADPFGGSAKSGDPQTFNRYAYVRNNPVNLTDATGLYTSSATFGHSSGSLLLTNQQMIWRSWTIRAMKRTGSSRRRKRPKRHQLLPQQNGFSWKVLHRLFKGLQK